LAVRLQYERNSNYGQEKVGGSSVRNVIRFDIPCMHFDRHVAIYRLMSMTSRSHAVVFGSTFLKSSHP